MNKLGTNYGGWIVPNNIQLNEDSIVYSGGVGEDISFDLLLQDKYNCSIMLIDPTERALKHFEEIKKYYINKTTIFSGDIQKDYLPIIQNLKPNFDKMKYYDIGLWNSKTELKFYRQNNPQYVSQSLIPNMFGFDYDTIQTTTIKEIMNENNHTSIDLLKLDIEGAEIEVLNNMLDDCIYPKYLCVEFDLFLKQKDTQNKTQNLVNRLLNNYKVLVNDNLNITFEYIVK